MVMLLTLEEVKQFLRVDADDDDMLINSLILTAEEYLKRATGKTFNNDNNLAKLLCMVLVTDWYDNRELVAGRIGDKVRFVITSMLAQLKYEDDDGVM